MSFQESPSQREAKARRDEFFGRPPLNGPALPPTASRVRVNPADAARQSFRDNFFKPVTPYESAVKKESREPSYQPQKEAKIGPKTGGKTKNEAGATGGTVIVKDCEGTELFRMTNVGGIDGEQELKAGCDGGSSYSVGS